MSILLAICLVGSAVFAKLPADRMKFVEQPITDWKRFKDASLNPLLTKESLAKLLESS